jgi:4-hydroxy-tetrahydrodipicolinate synthase
MEAYVQLRGSYTAIVTPFVGDAIDEHSLRSLARWHLEQGSSGIVACGTTGEAATLTAAETAQVIRACAEECHKSGKIVIAGAGTNATAKTVANVKQAKEAGADAALVVTPYYNKPGQEGLFRHYEAVARQGGLPVLAYNIPGRTACDMTAETVARLHKAGHLVGVKEASGNIARAAEIMEKVDDRFALLAGDDLFVAPTLSVGGAGVISAVANVIPGDFARLVDAFFAGDARTAGRIQVRMASLVKAMFLESNPQPVKYALQRMGRIKSGELRLPMVTIAADTAAKVDAALKAYGGLV